MPSPRSVPSGRLTPAAAALIALLLPPTIASAATWTVPTDASTIQAAIGLAAANDTVLVLPGTYSGVGNEDIDFGGKHVVLRSQAGAATTVLDGQGSGRALVFQNGEGNAAVVQGFTITNGRIGQGGGILCHGASPTLVDCAVTGNRADESGGGIMCRIGANPRIVRCRIEANSAFFSGGGISCIDASAEIVDSEVAGNEAGLLGGGIYCRNASPTLEETSVTGNRSNGAGGGLVFYHQSAPTVTACIVVGNRSAGSAGGVFCDDQAAPRFVDCVVAGNHTEGNGGAITCVGRSTARLEGSTLAGNRAELKGGGLYAENVSGFTVERTIVWGNCAGTDDEAHLVDAASQASFTCSAVDSSAVGGLGAVSFAPASVFGDPRFCSPQDCATAPTTGGAYGLDAGSPCLATASPCGSRIGALDQACGLAGVPGESRERAILSLSPQPFRDRLRIQFLLPGSESGPVRIQVHDLPGRLVRTLRTMSPGGSLEWDGNDAMGHPVPAGTYFIRVSFRGTPLVRSVARVR